jgi:hypothetical protein
MSRRRASLASVVTRCTALSVLCAIEVVSPQTARGEIDFDPTWRPPIYNDVRTAVLEAVDETDPTEQQRAEVQTLWPNDETAGGDRSEWLDRVAASFAIVDPRAAELVDVCRADYRGPLVPDASWLNDDNLSEFERDNLRVFYARWLGQFGLYDELLATLEGIKPDDVVDPASLLFSRMIAHQQLVHPDEARAALVQLLEQRDALPRRYQQVTSLLEKDLESLSDESLDHISRRMSDIRRRLAYGRTGALVQEIERGVVESLDRKIDKLEQQQQQQQSQGQSSSGSQQSQPMQDSQLPSMRAPMQVDQKDIGHKSDWGDLPPREREQALQQIGRDFPAHYRDLIEQYFRELAAESSSPDE